MSLLEELDDFLKKTTDAREVKRILAAKLVIQGKCHQEIEELLKVSTSAKLFTHSDPCIARLLGLSSR